MNPVDSSNDVMRLKRLRSLGSRRVKRGEEEENDLINPDINGAAQDNIPQNLPLPNEEMPIPLNPNIDVRANELSIPQPGDIEEAQMEAEQEPPSLMSRLGNGLNSVKNFLTSDFSTRNQTPPTPQMAGKYMHAGMNANIPQTQERPPTNQNAAIPEMEPEIEPGYMHAGKTPIIPVDPDEEYLTPSQMEFVEGMHPALREKSPNLQKKYNNTKRKQAREAAENNAGKTVVPGIANMILEDPVLSRDFKEYTGIDYQPQIASELGKYEKVLDEAIKGIDQSISTLDESEMKIRERLNNGQLSTQDKIMMGIALFLPMLVAGLVGGKEAAVGALGGSAQGLGAGLLAKEKMVRDDEEILRDVAKLKTEQQLKKAELGTSVPALKEKLSKSIPVNEKDELFKGMTEETIHTANGPVKGFRILPNIIADPTTIYDKESKNAVQKAGRELSQSKQVVKELDDITDDIIDVLHKVDLPEDVLSQAYQAVLTDKVPSIDAKLGTMIDYKGRRVNSAVLLNNKMALLKDAYRLMKKMRAFTNTVQEHTADIMSSPYGSFLSSQDLVDQMLSVREVSQNRLINEAISQGFLVEPILSEISQHNKPVAGKLRNREEQNVYKKATSKK